jgi:hypothetical protein
MGGAAGGRFGGWRLGRLQCRFDGVLGAAVVGCGESKYRPSKRTTPTHPPHPPTHPPNPQTWQYERYVTAAWKAGYDVREEVVGLRDESSVAEYAARCSHGVDADKIQAMATQWQDG